MIHLGGRGGGGAEQLSGGGKGPPCPPLKNPEYPVYTAVIYCTYMALYIIIYLSLQYLHPHVQTPLFVLHSLYDTWQLEHILQFNCSTLCDCPEEEKEAFYNYKNVSN